MRRVAILATIVLACDHGAPPARVEAPARATTLTGRAAFGDFSSDAPGIRRRIRVEDLPAPGATPSVDNGPSIVARPESAWPRAPAGFRVELFASGLVEPRMIRTAPNGELFVVESEAGRVKALRAGGERTFATGLRQPFGVAFWPPKGETKYVYIANTDSVVRMPWPDGGAPEMVVSDLDGGGRLRGGGHWTRDIVFSLDGTKMWVSVGSRSNVDDGPREARRARIFEYSADGKSERVYATGIRNPVGLAVNPETGELWTSVNERDGLGDDLVPDYVTRVRDGGFYGWPWFWLGAHEDPSHVGKHPELASRVLVPDVLVQAHSASLGMTFVDTTRFPREWTDGAFAAEHGSWNRERRTGYKVIFVPAPHGVPTGEYVDFLTGFVTPDGDAWGRPVAVAFGGDGALYVTDDAGGCVWKVSRP
ncbi:MAG TPA: PQQ-dependent sugar dehydrogenase [Labilithrix sp.]